MLDLVPHLKKKQDEEIAKEFAASIGPYLSDEKNKETIMPVLIDSMKNLIKTHPVLATITIAAIAIYHEDIARELKKLVS